nr:wax ester/triacylglycerol synthase family O-acyltransferase [uncultured Caldimonas sp.]
MSTYPMDPVDAAWYHMDGTTNFAIVTALLLTREPLDFQRVRDVFAHRLATIDRFRRRVVERGLPLPTPHWEDVPDFDIDQHLHHVAAPAPGDQQALAALIDDVASTPLPRELPLWQAHVVDGVDGGSALVLRYHHCIGDGLAMMAVAQQLFDATPQGDETASLAQAMPEDEMAAAPGAIESGLDEVEQAARRAWGAVASTWESVAHPQRWIEQGRVALQGAGMLIDELLKPSDPPSPFKGEFGLRQRVAWSRPVAIRDAKAIAAPLNAKVNDVLVAAVAGALRTYLAQRGVPVDRTTLRAMVPVNLRPPQRLGGLGNEFGLVILDLPVSVRSPMQRLGATKARMDALKRTPEAVAMNVLMDIFGRGPKALEEVTQTLFGSKASVVMTNVAGPRERLYLAGVPVERMMFWVPHPGQQLGMGLSVMSYRGKATLSVMADAHLVPDPQHITEAFNREFALMRRRLHAALARLEQRRGITRGARGAAPASPPSKRGGRPARPAR